MLSPEEFYRWVFDQLEYSRYYDVARLRSMRARSFDERRVLAAGLFHELPLGEQVEIAQRYAALGSVREECA